MEAIILAGGQGTRLRSVVSDRPKPLADVNGKPFLTYLLRHLRSAGVQRFIISVGFMSDMIIEYFGDEFEGIEICYSVENQPLGTGGAVKNSLTSLKYEAAFILCNGDTIFNFPLLDMLNAHNKNKCELTLALLKAPHENRYGLLVPNAEGFVSSIPDTKARKGALCSGGTYIINPSSLLRHTPPFESFSFESLWLPTLIKNKINVFGIEMPGKFIDIGVPRDYQRFCEDPSFYCS
jgi:D-glycero-alpha-D-manno-heptose 1-phosphate guanylyltransferase